MTRAYPHSMNNPADSYINRVHNNHNSNSSNIIIIIIVNSNEVDTKNGIKQHVTINKA
jgi:hypothetical protein